MGVNKKMAKANDEKIKSIFGRVLEKVKPKDDSIKKRVNEVKNMITDEIKKNNINARVAIGGSIAKDTFIVNDFDCDIFVRFDLSYNNDNLSDMLFEIIRPLFSDVLRVHGSRDYFQFSFKEIDYEVIPVYFIKDKSELKYAKNLTDFSPLHVDWFNSRSNETIRDNVRIAKQFLKAQKVYGAESFVNGFSGHLLDILMIYYGSFLDFLRNAIKWKKISKDNPKIIDVEGYYKGSNAIFFLNKSKISPLVVIDPIDKSRNAGAALSDESLSKMINAAKRFLDEPSYKFFEIRFLNDEVIKSKSSNKQKIIYFKIKPNDGNKDVAGTKVFKLYKQLAAFLRECDFDIFEMDFDWDKKNDIFFYYAVDRNDLSKTKIIKGPRKEFVDGVKAFIKKHSNNGDRVFVESEQYFAEVERKFTRVEDAVKSFINNKKEIIKGVCKNYEFSVV